MSALLDTSAILATLDRGEPRREQVVGAIADGLAGDGLAVHQMIVVETVAVLHSRIDKRAAVDFLTELLPQLELVHLGPDLMLRIQDSYIHASPRLSLVDVASFVVMRERGWTTAITFDGDFAREGFTVIP